jgi:hypothetical protein
LCARVLLALGAKPSLKCNFSPMLHVLLSLCAHARSAPFVKTLLAP